MMRVIATMPGHFGDILWAMATVRALAKQHQQPIELYVSKDFGDDAFLVLLEHQDYIAKAVRLDDWNIRAPIYPELAPSMPRTPAAADYLPTSADHVYHLGYRGWPKRSLPFETAAGVGVSIDLNDPWIKASEALHFPAPHNRIVVGFTQEWKELKYGLLSYLTWMRRPEKAVYEWLTHAGSCYVPLGADETNWIELARRLCTARLFLGDCSAPWVLAVAMGIPTVVMEPMEARHNSIFWVDLKDIQGRRLTRMVMGNDAKPTFDWNHTADELERVWKEFR